jgi:hypothetical protein
MIRKTVKEIDNWTAREKKIHSGAKGAGALKKRAKIECGDHYVRGHITVRQMATQYGEK